MKLTINNVSKAYCSNKALQHFTADPEPGIYALLGPNGSGTWGYYPLSDVGGGTSCNWENRP